MKEYPPRSSVETVNVCECGHSTDSHEMKFIDFWKLGYDNTGQCTICACPKYKLEKKMNKLEYIDNQNTKRSKI